MMSGRLHTKPKPGDVVFFTFPTDGETGPYNQMHVGIVTGSENFLRDGSFKVIEGQIDPGLPRTSNRVKNGVHVRTRYATDVVGFGRPALKPKSLTDELSSELPTKPVIKASIMKPGLKHRTVLVLQQELRSEKLFTGTYTGILDARTMAAVASFQRTIGYVGSQASGVPDMQTLQRLAQQRQTFNVTD
jgi:peptidoglycan hydrolase-like protein with peptidoglycan-binding domain